MFVCVIVCVGACVCVAASANPWLHPSRAHSHSPSPPASHTHIFPRPASPEFPRLNHMSANALPVSRNISRGTTAMSHVSSMQDAPLVAGGGVLNQPHQFLPPPCLEGGFGRVGEGEGAM